MQLKSLISSSVENVPFTIRTAPTYHEHLHLKAASVVVSSARGYRMGQVVGQFIVKTFIETTVCENCKRLCASVHGKPHLCPGLKGRRVGRGKVIVLGKHKTTVSVVC